MDNRTRITLPAVFGTAFDTRTVGKNINFSLSESFCKKVICLHARAV